MSKFHDPGHGYGKGVMVAKTETYVTCHCCGRGIRDNAEENAHFGQVPYPDDQGFGMCKDCGGDAKAPDIKGKLGWAGRCFFEARFDVVRRALSSENQAKWDTWPYERKVALVTRLVEKGSMI